MRAYANGLAINLFEDADTAHNNDEGVWVFPLAVIESPSANWFGLYRTHRRSESRTYCESPIAEYGTPATLNQLGRALDRDILPRFGHRKATDINAEK